MRALLTDLKATTMGYARSAAVVAQKRPLTRVDKRGSWLRGHLAPTTALPVVTFLPQTENIAKRLSGGLLHVDRTIRIEVYDKGLVLDDVKRSVLELVEDVREAISSNPWIHASDPTKRKTVFTYELGPVDYGEIEPLGKGVVLRGVFNAVFRSKETIGPRTLNQTYKTTETNNLTDQIVQTLKSPSGAFANQKLAVVRKIDSFEQGVSLPTPAVGIYPVNEAIDKFKTSREAQLRTFEVWVVTKLLAKEAALDQALDIFEGVKQALSKNFQFGGLAANSEIGTIGFGSDEKGLVYVIRIPLIVQSFERITYAQ